MNVVRIDTSRIIAVVTLACCMLASFAFPVAADPYLGGIPLETMRDGEVTGGLFVDAVYPMTNDASASFSIPEYTAVRWARLYVVAYCGHMQNNYQIQAHIEFNGGKGFSTLGTEILNVPYTYPGEGGTGAVRLNDHTTRVTSDYIMWYDVKDQISEKNLKVRVKTSKPAGYTGTFDGRVKTVALVVAYDDGDKDRIEYWINQGHDEDGEQTEEILGESYVGETSFSTSILDDDWEKADLTVIHLASENAEYEFNGESLVSGNPQGAYGGLDRHDVTDCIWSGKDSDLTYDNTGRFFKIMLATLAVRYPGSDTGTLKITSYPDGATIILDGEEQEDLTNTTLSEIPPGYHTVSVEKEGYKNPGQQSIQIQTGVESKVHFTFQQGSGILSVESDPESAKVLIDGITHTGLTPCVITGVPAGEHEIILRLSGYQDWIESVDIEDGERYEVEADLAPALSGGSSSSSTSAGGETGGTSGYRGSSMTLYRKGALNGTFFSMVASDYTGMIPSGEKKTYTLPETVPEGSEVVLSRLYLYTTWSHDMVRREGIPARPIVSWNGKQLQTDVTYTDRKKEGIYDYPVETFAYDLKGIIRPGEQVMVDVANGGASGQEFAAYGVFFLAVLKNSTVPEISYWICEGSDIVYADPRFGTSAEDCRTRAEFPGDVETAGISKASVVIVSTAASGEGGDQHQVIFNDGEWYNALSEGSSGVSTASLDVLPWLSKKENSLELVSLPVSGKGDYMENRNAILVVIRGENGEMQPEEIATSADSSFSVHQESERQPYVDSSQSGITKPEIPESLSPHSTTPSPGYDGRSPSLIDWVFGQLLAILGLSHLPPVVDTTAEAPDIPAMNYSLQGSNDLHTLGTYSPGTGAPDIPPAGEQVNDNEGTSQSAGDSQSVVSLSGYNAAGSRTMDKSLEKVVTGGVFVDSYPEGASIFIDGRQIASKTPYVANWLKEGIHTIKVEKETFSFTPESRQVWVNGGEITSVHFSCGATMVRRLTINSTEWKGAQFTVNGKGPILQVPSEINIEGMAPFISIFNSERWYSHTIPARIEDGSEVLIDNTSDGTAGMDILSNPVGATILIDGFNTGDITPARVENLSSGQHLVEFLLPGYYPASKLVTLVDNPSEPCDMTIIIPLEEYLSGTLTIDSDVQGAKIYVFNKDTGRRTPSTFEHLSIGTIQGKVRWDDTENGFEVDVLPGRNVSVMVKQHTDTE